MMSFVVSNMCFEYLTGSYKNLFSMKLHYGGRFTECPNRKYVEGEVTFVDMIDMQQFNSDLLYSVLNSSGYDCSGTLYFHYKIPLKGLDNFLKPLVNESDFEGMLEYVTKHKTMYVYVENGNTTIGTVSEGQEHSDGEEESGGEC